MGKLLESDDLKDPMNAAFEVLSAKLPAWLNDVDSTYSTKPQPNLVFNVQMRST